MTDQELVERIVQEVEESFLVTGLKPTKTSAGTRGEDGCALSAVGEAGGCEGVRWIRGAKKLADKFGLAELELYDVAAGWDVAGGRYCHAGRPSVRLAAAGRLAWQRMHSAVPVELVPKHHGIMEPAMAS